MRQPRLNSEDLYAVRPCIVIRSVVSPSQSSLQKQRFEALYDQTPDMILFHDRDGTITDVNARAADRLGLDPDALGESKIWDIDTDADPDRATDFWKAFPEDETTKFEGTFLTDSGKRIPVEIHLRALDKPAGEFLAIAREIGERKAAQHQLEQKTAALERQNQRLREFADVLAHDIPNHLTVAEGYLDRLTETRDPNASSRIRQALERIETLTTDMHTAVQTGEPIQTTKVVSLAEIATASWGSCCVEDEPQSLEIASDGMIQADPGRLKQLFENLYWNSCDHGPEDVSIRVGWLPDGFYIEDDGPGIEPDDRERVLDPGVSTGDRHHSGLGLTIVREIARAHDWDLRIRESPDGGARFEFTGVTVIPEDETEARS